MQTNHTEAVRAADHTAPGRPVWAIPLGLGIGLLSVGGFFVLVAQGLAVLASIG